MVFWPIMFPILVVLNFRDEIAELWGDYFSEVWRALTFTGFTEEQDK